MTTTADLTPLLKRLKLGALLPTLPERLALARREQLDYAAFLQVLLVDEVTRRDHGRLERQVLLAGFEQVCRLEDFDWSAHITLDRRLLDAACSLDFVQRHEHVLLVGPVGVGKTFLAQALGYAAIRAGYAVRFMRADQFFVTLAQARVDHTLEKAFRSFLAPDLLILDDLGLHRLTAQQSVDLYELIIGRHRRSSFVVTSNRSVDEWLGLFDDPILGNSALDRLANASYQIVVEGGSYRERLSPHRRETRTQDASGAATPSAGPAAGGRHGRTPVS
jgi:DNA replication protein DnaC